MFYSSDELADDEDLLNEEGFPSPGGDGRPDIIQRLIDETLAAEQHYVAELGFKPLGEVNLFMQTFRDRGLALPGFLADPAVIFIAADDDDDDLDYLGPHELFHQIQYRYINTPTLFSSDSVRWWMEATAEWATRRVTARTGGPDTTIYTENLDAVLAEPWRTLNPTPPPPRTPPLTGKSRPGLPGDYGSFILAEFLSSAGPTERRQSTVPTAIRATWERIGTGALGTAAVDVVQDELADIGGGSFADGLATYRLWSYVLGRDNTGITSFGFGGRAGDAQLAASISDWRADLADRPETEDAATGFHRPARVAVPAKSPAQSQSEFRDRLSLMDNGVAYYDIPTPSDVQVQIDLSARDPNIDGVVLPLKDPETPCGEPIDIERTVRIEVQPGCNLYTLVILNTGRETPSTSDVGLTASPASVRVTQRPLGTHRFDTSPLFPGWDDYWSTIMVNTHIVDAGGDLDRYLYPDEPEYGDRGQQWAEIPIDIDPSAWDSSCQPTVFAYSEDYRHPRPWIGTGWTDYDRSVWPRETIQIGGRELTDLWHGRDRVSRTRNSPNRGLMGPYSTRGWEDYGWRLSRFTLPTGAITPGRTTIRLPIPHSGYEIDLLIVAHSGGFCGPRPTPPASDGDGSGGGGPDDGIGVN